jgi:hypothetical protein
MENQILLAEPSDRINSCATAATYSQGPYSSQVGSLKKILQVLRKALPEFKILSS